MTYERAEENTLCRFRYPVTTALCLISPCFSPDSSYEIASSIVREHIFCFLRTNDALRELLFLLQMILLERYCTTDQLSDRNIHLQLHCNIHSCIVRDLSD